ncbi:TonB-dependent receptor [Porticoccus sp. W117]|uniref:TonB-dependent receptor n=1 Tax=Porticoccus sp. W117 TaxID=3054777 RepID=UPI00259420EF|nr:TonB-dependent receptor [Porticoccus sp. W117]MDM3870473.1 TonB-dependent receptor [Porticoccus sp. W117]
MFNQIQSRDVNKKLLVVAIASTVCGYAVADSSSDSNIEEEIVTTARAQLLGFGESHANNTIRLEDIKSQTPANDVLNFINRLPGVNVTQGDAIGSNDWSTRVSIRGMTNGRSDSQVGYMVDGMPNGASNYGGGQKPNRYIDSENVARINVGQNASDISSASNSALGGTVRYYTADPSEEFGVKTQFTGGDDDLQRGFFRIDSGEIADGLTSYLSYSESSVSSWIGAGSGDFDRQHADLKIVRDYDDGLTIKFKGSYNYRNENDFDSVSLQDFRDDPTTDGLVDVFDYATVGDFRPAWGGTRRDNAFSLEITKDNGDSGKFTMTPYYHHQAGSGWWAPPYIWSKPDGQIEGERGPREYFANTFARNADGVMTAAASPVDVSGIPCLAGRYDGDEVGFELNPAFDCATAERVATRRRSGYATDRLGFTAENEMYFGNHKVTVGAWYEYQDRDNSREWFLLDPNNPGTINPSQDDLFHRDFDRNFESATTRLYVEDRIDLDKFEVTAGLVWHRLDTEYVERLESESREQTRDELLPKLGVVYNMSDSSEFFASYSRNVKMLSEGVLAAGDTRLLSPETSDNLDIGYRWNGDNMGMVVQVFSQRFQDRLGVVNIAALGGDQFAETAANFLNIGGVENNGLEFALSYDISDSLSTYGSYSYLSAKYSETEGMGESIREGDRILNVPENQLFGEVTWSPEALNNNLRLSLNVKHVGEVVGLNEQRNENQQVLRAEEVLDAYTLVGLSATYAMQDVIGLEDLEFQLNAVNLLDEQYLSGTDGDQGGRYFLGAPQTLSLTVRANF